MDKHIKLIHDLVSIPSVSGDEKKASEYLVKEMKKRGAQEATLDEVNNAIGIWGTGPKELWLVGHIDTVPGEIDVRIEDNKLYGRGSVDAKGCLATFVEAVSQIKIPTMWKLMVVGCVEEEIHSSKGARNLFQRAKPETIIIGEPSSSGKITISYKGSLRAQAKFISAEEHSSTARENSHELAINYWNQVKAWADEHNQDKSISQLLQANLISINSNNDGLVNECELELRFRIPVGMTSDKVEKKLMTIDPRPLTINIRGQEEPILSDKNTKLVRSFLAAMRDSDITPRFSKKTGTADMNVLGHHYDGVPIVAFGPGDSSLDHTPNEHLDLEDYEVAIEVLKKTLQIIMTG